jgi:hypothetical protein
MDLGEALQALSIQARELGLKKLSESLSMEGIIVYGKGYGMHERAFAARHGYSLADVRRR